MEDVSPFWASSSEDDEVLALLAAAGYTEVVIQRRKVKGGILRAIRDCSPPENNKWHLAITHYPRRKRRAPRFPTWAEAIEARNELLPANLTVIMRLPSDGDDKTMHLYEH